VAHHEDEAGLAIEVDVEDPADLAVAAEAAVVSQEVEAAVASHEVVAVVVVALVAADVEVTKSDLLSSSSLCLPLSTTRRSILPYYGLLECHDYYQPIPRSSFDGVWEFKWGYVKDPTYGAMLGIV
jgi:hypothetical protein